jgi:hypothetical protein
MIQRDLKHTAVPVEEILEKERQIKLAEWPEFRGIPETISYHDRPGHVSYIRFIDTEKFHRAAALALLDENLAAVHQTREALARGDRFSDLLIARYGENPLWKLLQFWMEEGRPGLGEIGA